ncbi:septin-7-like isoform X2 [Liolophura sinensis]|uniref:septin-7-like isoform X2 n=1 Tax=Liolophura sinensis TaxID=3198878 RepID=UPI003157F262
MSEGQATAQSVSTPPRSPAQSPAAATKGSGRVPPPTPEKPDKAKLLQRSSFRREADLNNSIEKAKYENRNSPSRSTVTSGADKNSFSNGERSPSPGSNVTRYISYSERSGVNSPDRESSSSDLSNKDLQSIKPGILSAKREAFFKMEPPAPKFDPSARSGLTSDRERERPHIREREPIDHDRYMEKNHRDNHKELEGYVGFANLPNQVYRKSVKRGFEFTLMVVGESGLGKSTLINSLFLTDLYSAEYPGPSHRIQKTVKVDTTQVSLKENGVHLKLTIVDTPGFGDAVDNSNCWQPITDFIDSKYEEYLTAESRVNRVTIVDSRVHTCLYFIAPTGHGLKPLDVEFMKRLHDKVNIIPLIAKSDTMTPDECREFKKTILNEIAQHKIKIYEFPDCDDEDENKHQKKLKDRVPFAVVGSNTIVDSGGKRVRGRQYPWGVVEVENLEHNDFIALRNMLIRTHMQDLKDVTNNVHYENYRYSKLAPVNVEGKVKAGSLSKDPLTQMQEEKKEHEAKMKKMEAEMEQVFEMKVKEKKQKLKDSEIDLQRRAEQMKKSLEQQKKELDEKWKAFEKEKHTWEDTQETEKQSDKKNKKKSIF